MRLCQRLLLTGICARSAIFSEGRPVQISNAKSSSCRLNFFRFISVAKTAAKLKVDVKVINVRRSSTKYAETLSSTLAYLLKWGTATLLVTTFVSLTVVWWELWSLKRNMSSVTADLASGSLNKADIANMTALPLHPWRAFFNNDNSTLNNNDFGVWFPWLQSKSQDPFTLLDLCRSKNPAIRKLGVRALAAKTAWDDYQYRYVAQAADVQTLIGLSRSRGSDSRFFLPPPSLVQTHTPVSEELASMLLLLDQQEPHGDGADRKVKKGSPMLHSRTALLAHQHLHHKHRPTDDKIHFWGFDGSSLDVASVDAQLPEEQLLLQFLTAVGAMCQAPDQASLFLRGNGLAVLQRITEQYENTETFTAVASVLGNLALHASTHKSIVSTGWLGTLKSWAEGQNSKLAVMAARALINMDRDWSPEVLDSGVFILYPLHRSRKTVHADMVFVHGLLGGGVKTWRQQDAAYHSAGPNAGRTDCWPKDWLAKDCPHVRIISVHYDTALSTWSASDTVSKEKCTLLGRSQELLEKLYHAGVGKRPIIWVGHSMGGLLIKQMLELCEGDVQYGPLREQTCGLLLYAVPHRGLSLAAITSQVHYLLFPSTEVQELRADSPHLKRLHEHFKQFVENDGIPCMSFGEQLKTNLRKTLPKILLVPPQSSDPGVGEFSALPLNHVNICKPDSRDSNLYQQTLSFVHRCIFFSYVHRLRRSVAGTLD
ncbi:protein SERAC1-like [Babylonia areolata]|uniref:protein SERAC1-like n=1 Tax=Babylonia areolata TaxID=304850 RepID=UPI003FD55033